jgi:glycosyltransferase involved in cell wall biosynthesis
MPLSEFRRIVCYSAVRMHKLKVAFVAPSLEILGGQAVQADRLLHEWKGDAEVEAWLVPVNPRFPRFLRWARSVKYLRTVINELIYIPSLIGQLRRADLVHVFSASYSSFLLAPLPAIAIARLLGRPVLLNYRSGQAPDHLTRSRVARWALRSVQRNVVPSRFLVEVFARFGIEASVVPNVVDFSRFGFRQRATLRPRILSTRNFESLYNVECTIRAFRLVQDEFPDATLTLVGGGTEEAALRALVQELGLKEVAFVGRVDPNDVARFYHDHDVYVQTPNIDNMPTSVIEAFACGLAVVSTEAGGVPAIMTNGVHGLLAPIDDHSTVGRLVLDLLTNPATARQYTLAARDSIQGCTWSAVRDQWLRAYRSALETVTLERVGRGVANPVPPR